MPAEAPVKTARTLSIYDCARELKCSHVAVYHAVERLGILPDTVTVSGQSFYSENILIILRDNIKQRGGNGK